MRVGFSHVVDGDEQGVFLIDKHSDKETAAVLFCQPAMDFLEFGQ